MTYSATPTYEWQKHVLERSRHLTEFRWTPIKEVVTYTRKLGKFYFPVGEEIKGFPYSSPEPIDKFICENVSFETFISAVNNPDSVLYNKDMGGDHDGRRWTYYGIVCNGLVRYAYGLDRRYNTRRWLEIPGMQLVFKCQQYKASDIQLCDILHVYLPPERSHVAMITDILRDKNNVITHIEVSEAIRTSCARRIFTVDEYFEKYKHFDLVRYDYVQNVPPADKSINKLLFENKNTALPDIAVDNGDKSNYSFGQTTLISVFKDGEVCLYRNGSEIEKFNAKSGDKFYKQLEEGYYVAKLDNGSYTEFCITNPQIEYTVENDTVNVHVNLTDKNSQIYYMDFRGKLNFVWGSLAKIEELTDEEKTSGNITRKIPEDGVAFKIYYKNKYGIYTHQMKFVKQI